MPLVREQSAGAGGAASNVASSASAISALPVEGDAAYLTWKATGITFGTDTFVVRDGKIVLQAVAMHLA